MNQNTGLVISGSLWISRELRSLGYQADFSPDSLWEIDRFYDDNCQNGMATPEGFLSQDLDARLYAIGAYVGEVMRRAVGGEWIFKEDKPGIDVKTSLRLPDGSRQWPVQRVFKRFISGSEYSIAVWGIRAGLQIRPRPR